MCFRDKILALPKTAFSQEDISIRPISSENDLWYATEVCRLAPGQEEYVNSSAFSIGRAYLQPNDNIPCLIYHDTSPVGFLLLRHWEVDQSNGWSYYLDHAAQGFGYGTAAAKLAVRILKQADPEVPIKLTAEVSNIKAHHLYQKIGFALSDELDGDDLVFVL